MSTSDNENGLDGFELQSAVSTFNETFKITTPLREMTLRLHAAIAENEILRRSVISAHQRIELLEETVRVLRISIEKNY